ncbi:MAG TPA: phasin family protein [Steroidobacteraceae bacterium]|nr:phasin family protein [Steroidobacteraceae bacterium]
MTEQPTPFSDFNKLIEQFKVPGVDLSAIIESGRKDFEALAEANKAAYQGLQALARKQGEVLTEAMQKVQDAAKHAAGMPADAKSADVAREAYKRTLAHMKEMAEIVRNSNAEAMTKVADRAIEHLQDLKKMIQTKPK